MVNRCHFLAVGNKKAALLYVLSPSASLRTGVSKGATGRLIEIIQIIKSSLFWRMADGG